MATFAELKRTARKLNIPVTIDAFLPKLALSPEAMTTEQIIELFESSARKPAKVQVALLVKIVEQAAIDFPDETKGASSNKRKPQKVQPPVEDKKPEPKKPVGKEEATIPEEEPAKNPSTEKPVEYIRELDPEDIEPEVVEPVEQFDLSDYEQVSLSLSADRSPQTLSIESSGNQTTVSWAKSNTDDLVYVLAASNSAMPSVIRGADEIRITRSNQVALSGTFKYFKLFEFAKPKTKGQPIASGQVLGDITELVIETYPHEVRIKWSSSDPSAVVAIYKSRANESLPSNLTAEFKLDIARDTTNHTDRNVQPGQSFEYCAVLESQTVSGTVQASSGKRQHVAIPGDVPKVENFKVEFDANHETVSISYTRPKLELARIKVFQIPGVPSSDLKAALADERVIPFERLKQEDIEGWLGKEIIESEVFEEETPNTLEMRRIPLRDPEKEGSVTYVAVSTLGADALISKLEVLHLVGSIGELKLFDRFDYQILRTEVPEGADLLKVYEAPQGSSFEEVKNGKARNVIVADEYKRFGGILWGDNVPGVPEIGKLPVTPIRIWVEGVAMYDGKAHAGAPRYVDYPGRVEISYQLALANKSGAPEPTQKKGLFGKKDAQPKAAKNPLRHVKVKVNAPSKTGDLKFTIRTTAKGIFNLDDASASSVPEQVTLLQADFKTEKEIIVEKTKSPFVFDIDKNDFRLKSVGASSDEIPRFIIDAVIASQSQSLSEERIQQKTLSVAILGAKQSGKTTYLQALLNYFDQQFSAKYATRLTAPEGNSLSEARLQVLQEFIKTGTLPEATTSAGPFALKGDAPGNEKDPRTPIQFEFGGKASPIKSIDIYDLAGEDMDSPQSMAFYENQLAQVDLIILLVDPMQGNLAQVLRGAVAAPPKGTAPFDVLMNLEGVLKDVDGRNPLQKLAVVVSKFDGIEVAAEMEGTPIFDMLDKGLSMTRDVNTNSTKQYNDYDGIILDREVLALIGKFGDMAAFTRALKDSDVFQQKRCFIVSSLGHSTDATRMDKAGITSFRISDPILWALDG
jgi:hypothetical protein